ncbi:membrane dipeptidase [Vibrio sp. SCSIO 43135]|uniref:dipeptidase n=1 Tax=Vibrio sp. SCSIO 43135 TaxID=2819096 RepID=UPI0020756DD9|nr:membrane dipeptidase [Vibrio sp. SCSIO 43135]USD43244.1 membrane dipeptidase [Vibrio sp. SCSIO 43135]
MQTRKVTTLALATAFFSSYSFSHDIGHDHIHVEGGWTAKAGFVSDTDFQAPLWNARGKSEQEIKARAAYLATIYDAPRSPSETQKDALFREKFGDAIFINSVLPAAVGVTGFPKHLVKQGYKRNQEAGVSVASVSLYNYPSSQIKDIDYSLEQTKIAVQESGARQAHTTLDIRNAKADGKMSVIFNVQGSDFLIDDLSQMPQYAREGIKVMNFTYNADNALAGGGSANNKGLTTQGIEFVKLANKSGVVIDVSHSSSQTAVEAAKYSSKPIVASHSNAAGLHNIGRNLSDEAIIAIGKTNGAVCTTGVGMFLNEEGDASPEAFAKHVVYTANLIGRDKTCFSTDYLHNYQDFVAAALKDSKRFPPELGFGGFTYNTTIEQGWAVARILQEQYDWSDEEIRGFLGENLMRVYAENWHEVSVALGS